MLIVHKNTQYNEQKGIIYCIISNMLHYKEYGQKLQDVKLSTSSGLILDLAANFSITLKHSLKH